MLESKWIKTSLQCLGIGVALTFTVASAAQAYTRYSYEV